MNKSKNVPKIRFDGFSGEWENKKLGEIFLYEQPNKYIVSIANYSDDYKIPVLTAGQSFILGYTNEGYGIKNASKDFPVIIFDDFTTSSHYVDFPFKVKSSAMKILTTDNKKYSFYYLYTVLKNINYKPICHERQWISIFSNFNILIPKLKEEQKLIGQYFSNIDNLIKLQQQKYEKLLNLKKSLLYKLFPKEGETVPELRFEGFSGKWEKKKLGNCFSERTESYPEGELLSVTINQGIKKFSELDRKNNSNDNKSKYKKVYVGDIAYNSMRMWQGASGYSEYEGIVSPAYTVLSPNDVIDSKCFSYLFKRTDIIHMFQIYSKGITSDNWNLKYPDFKELEVYVSQNYNEQKAIGQYFSKLDKLIELSKEKLEKLKNVKESLLDKMFV